MKPAKSYLNENEAAEFLGVSAARLRTLIRSHVTTEEADLSKVGMTQFQPADLLLLRFLIGQSASESEPGGPAQLAEAAAGASVTAASGECESGSTLTESVVPAAS